jgi:hypothetical protein
METITSRDGTTIAFDWSGEGPAVVLVGGAFQHRAFDPRTRVSSRALPIATKVERAVPLDETYDQRRRTSSSA